MGAGVVHRDVDVGGGLTIHVAECGSGPPIVLLHGFTGSTETWAPFLPEFAAANRVIAIDQPGHGRSTAPADPRRYGLRQFSGDLATVLDSMGVDRAVLLGYSMGARAALRFVIDHPQRVAGVVLESASPGIADEKERLERTASDDALADKIEREGIEAFVAHWETLSLWDTQKVLPASTRDEQRRQRLSNNPVGLANSLRGAGTGEEADILAAASAIGSPTLLIAGALDSKYVRLGKQLHGSIPGSRLDIIADSGHITHLEQPGVFASVTMAFVQRLPSDGHRWT